MLTDLTNRATREGTERYVARLGQKTIPSNGYVRLGRTGLMTSRLGFGTYRVAAEMPEHREALDMAFRAGCNLVDTSTNYMDGSSERCISDALEELIQEGFLKRDEVIIVSKVGYVQGDNLAVAKEREEIGTPFPEMVKYTEECWHCIHPEFIEDQLTRSLERLKLKHIDVFLLHNPEYFFSSEAKTRSNKALADRRVEFYQRVRGAFEHLEQEVERGRIGFYGVSSNTFGEDTDDPEMTSITRMWEIAREVRPNGHHFSVIQLPLNLFETGPVVTKNNGPEDGLTAVQFAKSEDLGLLTNRPLNAFFQKQLIRLADFPSTQTTDRPTDWIKPLTDLEEQFAKKFDGFIRAHFPNVQSSQIFRWSNELKPGNLVNVDAAQWSTMESDVVRPHIENVFRQLDEAFEKVGNNDWPAWRNEYSNVMEKILGALRCHAFRNSQRQSDAITTVVGPFIPVELEKESLSRKVLAILMQTPGVHCVLNGMRTRRYVEDSMGALRFANAQINLGIYGEFNHATTRI